MKKVGSKGQGKTDKQSYKQEMLGVQCRMACLDGTPWNSGSRITIQSEVKRENVVQACDPSYLGVESGGSHFQARKLARLHLNQWLGTEVYTCHFQLHGKT
jgi:hypothetical protein